MTSNSKRYIKGKKHGEDKTFSNRKTKWINNYISLENLRTGLFHVEWIFTIMVSEYSQSCFTEMMTPQLSYNIHNKKIKLYLQTTLDNVPGLVFKYVSWNLSKNLRAWMWMKHWHHVYEQLLLYFENCLVGAIYINLYKQSKHFKKSFWFCEYFL